MTGSSAPHWPDELGRLSKGMRRELVHKVAGAALSASQLFPDNSQLYLALYNCIQRHVFFTRKPSPCFVALPHMPRSSLQATQFTAAETLAPAFISL